MGRTDKLFRIFATTAECRPAEQKAVGEPILPLHGGLHGDIFESHSGLMAGKERTAGSTHAPRSLQGSTPTLPLQYPKSKPKPRLKN